LSLNPSAGILCGLRHISLDVDNNLNSNLSHYLNHIYQFLNIRFPVRLLTIYFCFFNYK
jgi:hypothetical protein